MSDKTKVFKQEVKKLRNLLQTPATINTSILPTKKRQFEQNANNVLSTIKQLDQLLTESKDSYIGSTCSNRSTNMSDQQRIELDNAATSLILLCKNAIKTLSVTAKGQLKEHEESVIIILTNTLKQACDRYSHTRALHVSQALEQHKLSRLSSHKLNTSDQYRLNSSDQFNSAGEEEYEELDLSESELQQLELENDSLYNELTSLSSEVQSIESTVMEISRLQEIFTEKVLTQSDQISDLHKVAVETVENTRGGNDELREAIKNSAGFRVWLLFFFVMASCCLLFLDWYS